MLKYDFDESVGYWIFTAWRAYERAVNAELAPHGLKFRQSQVLGWLALEGDLTQGELAERMGVEPPTLVPQLDRMEREGWIRRVHCASDRRKKIIRPRPEAVPVWSKVVACAKRVRCHATAGLSEEEVAALRNLLAVVRDNLDVETAAAAS